MKKVKNDVFENSWTLSLSRLTSAADIGDQLMDNLTSSSENGKFVFKNGL